jgi:hypothetical protein
MNWEGQGPSEDDDAPALFPLIDSLNHYPITKITWQTGDSALSIVSGGELASGAEVYNNYGPKPNGERMFSISRPTSDTYPSLVLMGYGFALLSNPFDAVLLRFSPSPTSSQQSLHALQPPHPTPGLYHLTPRNHTPTTPSIYPAALLNLFHILTATPYELRLLQSNPTSQTITFRNTLSTHSQLLLAIRRKINQIPPTVPPPKNSKQVSALYYREGQLAILTSAIQESATMLQSAIASNKFITLQSALLSPAFNHAVESCFGASDLPVLQDTQQDEIVLILYICHLRITQLSPSPVISYSQQEVQKDVKQLYADIFPSAAIASPEIFGGEAWTEELLDWGMKTYMECGVTVYPDEEGGVFGVCLE